MNGTIKTQQFDDSEILKQRIQAYDSTKPDPLYLYALWLCIQKNNATYDFLQKKLYITRRQANAILSWMEDQGYAYNKASWFEIMYMRKKSYDSLLITKDQFLSQYGKYSTAKKFSKWRLEGIKEILLENKRNYKRKPYTMSEYQWVLKHLFSDHEILTKKQFIRHTMKQLKLYKRNIAIQMILKRIIKEFSILTEEEFQNSKKIILNEKGGR